MRIEVASKPHKQNMKSFPIYPSRRPSGSEPRTHSRVRLDRSDVSQTPGAVTKPSTSKRWLTLFIWLDPVHLQSLGDLYRPLVTKEPDTHPSRLTRDAVSDAAVIDPCHNSGGCACLCLFSHHETRSRDTRWLLKTSCTLLHDPMNETKTKRPPASPCEVLKVCGLHVTSPSRSLH